MSRKSLLAAGGAFLILTGILSLALWKVTESLPQIPEFSKVRDSYLSSELFLLDRKGRPLQQLRLDHQKRALLWTKSSEISPAVRTAVLKSEDRRFLSHHGVDWSALLASSYQRILNNSPRGGSTISMQMVKLLNPQGDFWRGFTGKLRQILAVQELEQRWSKEQIFEAYVNLVNFRGEIQGISTAAWKFFDRKSAELNLSEATLLAVQIRSPNATSKKQLQRACWQEPSLCEDMRKLLASEMQISSLGGQNVALHLGQRLGKAGRRGQVHTTLNRDLQTYIQEQIQTQIRKLEAQNVHDAAVMVIENNTGEVWAYVGGSGNLSSAPFVDGVQALRQAGSTLKPFLYATAFEKNILRPDSWLEDSAVDIVFDRGVYKPQNHDRHFYGWVQVRTALGSSLNVPAVKAFKLLNDESFWSVMKALKFRDLREPEHYGPALALGVADVTLEDLTQAYRTLAQDGFWSDIKFELGQEALPSYSVLGAGSARSVREILSENQYRTLGFGLDSDLNLPGTAVKTGTSKDMRDNWCVGMNARFTVGVWLGNFDGQSMWNVMGVSGAAPIWRKTMLWLQEHYPAETSERQKSLVQESQNKPQPYPQVRIAYPLEGMVLALDPAIPKSHQKMPLIFEGKGKDLYWRINDGQKIKVTEAYLWSPLLGRHRFSLYEGAQKRGEVSILVK